MENINCKQCEASISPLAEFPGGICVDCYSIEFDKQPMPTADEVADMFRGSVSSYDYSRMSALKNWK